MPAETPTFLQKISVVHNHPKITIFLGLFWSYHFPCFPSFSFSFSNIKRQKQKLHIFVRKPFVDTLTNCQKIIFAPICDFKDAQKETIKLGKKQAKTNRGPSFDATLDQVLTQKNPNLGPSFDSTICIYIYMCMGLSFNRTYLLPIGLIGGNTSGHFWKHLLFLIYVLSQKKTFIRCPKVFPTIRTIWPKIGPKSQNIL